MHPLFLLLLSHHGDEASDKLEVVQVIRIDVGCRVDLQTVVVLVGVLEEAVHRIQHFMRQQQEPLPVQTMKSLLSP